MPELKVGDRLPAFTLATTGGEFRSRAKRDGPLVIYFYPRDNTPGCTQEGADFRDLAPAFRKLRATILGVSTDSLESHGRFRDKMKFPFELGSDEDHAVASLFGVWKQKNMYGKKMMGIVRSTFLVDGSGVVRAEWRKLRVAGHAGLVLAATRGL